MKKTLVIMLALFLAIPAISYAGSATSRWDLTIGGVVKFDAGWATTSGIYDNDMWSPGVPMRNPVGSGNAIWSKYGTQMWGGGETGLNFFIKGPDAWGAKTHAFILGDFTGVWGAGNSSTTNYNTFNLLIAEMGFDWTNTSMTAGIGGSFFGMIPTFANSTAWGDLNFGGKGASPVVPSITITQRFTKTVSAGFGVMSPYNQTTVVNQPGAMLSSPDANYFRNPLPAFEGMVKYSSDSCGKVGPWQLLVEADGFWGKLRNINDDLTSHDVAEWIGDFKFLIPIIPEKNGNKAGALYFDAEVFAESGAGQGGNYFGFGGGGNPGASGANEFNLMTSTYPRSTEIINGAGNSYTAAVAQGFTTHAAYYLTDAVSVNGFYIYTTVNASRALKAANPMDVQNIWQTVGNIVYDVNPALRLTLEWDHTDARYAAPVPGFKMDGTSDDFRICAQYFF
jgi:hypothetical protein